MFHTRWTQRLQWDATNRAMDVKGLFTSKNVAFALFVIASLFAFWIPVGTLVSYALHPGHEYDAYSHTILVPFISLCLAYFERKRTFSQVHYSPPAGIILALVGASLNWLAENNSLRLSDDEYLSLKILSLVVVWVSGFVLLYGIEALRAGAFPILFLLLTVPIPDVLLHIPLAIVLRESAEVSYVMFRMVGVPVFRDGFVFSLAGLSIEIAQICSGIHSILALFMMSLLAGHFYLKSLWKRALLTLAVFPIVGFTNGLRIAVLSLLANYVDREFLSGNLHKSGGVIFFALGLIFLAFLVRLFRGRKQQEADVLKAI